MHRLLEAVCDPGSVLELKPYFDGSLITALARIEGRVVGVLANNPKVTAGAMGPGACEKATSLICLCDSFHIPLVFLHDTPGFFVGRRAEEGAMPLKIMNWIEALHLSSVPRISVVVRKSYGMAHCNMSGGNMGSDALLAWPNADVSFMAPAVAVNVVYGRKLQEMKDPAAARDAFMEEISRANAPWDAAGRNYIDRIIDPRDTRIEIAHALARAAGPDGQGGRSRRRLANWPRMA
jgi:acetyl-CoA carboxylase carboxyltransferase component